MTTNKICGRCATALDLDGLCPRCLALEFFTPHPGSEPPAYINAPPSIEDYEILEEIARGGMGVVYRARQRSLDRIVALKMVQVSPRLEPHFQERFRTEAMAAAGLNHPGIVGVHEIGEANGCVYFSMEYVAGSTLAEMAAGNPLEARMAADCLRQAAEAIQYAHEARVVHRDLKPSNLIRDLAGRVRITDFGLAKRLESSSDLTLHGQPLGTPAYMAPEQIAPGSATSSPGGSSIDIYSLGATLYHLLTGRPPFVGESLTAVLNQVATNDPLSPRLLNPAVPRDLETICLKCLAKAPERRYATAGQLAEDLRRFLEDKPIQARPVSQWERAWRWCGRNPALAASFFTVLALLALIAANSHYSAARISRLHLEALTNLYAADMRLASQAVAENRFGFAMDLLAQHQPKPDEPDLRGFEWYCLYRQCRSDEEATLGTHEAQAQRVAFAPTGRLAASAASDLRIWDCQTHQLVKKIPFRDFVSALAFSSDGRKLAVSIRTGEIYCFDCTDFKELARLTNLDAAAAALRWIAGKSGFQVVAGRQSFLWRPGQPWESAQDLGDAVVRASLSDQGHLAAITVPGWKVWVLTSAPPTIKLESDIVGPVRALALAHAGNQLVAGDFGGHLWCLTNVASAKSTRFQAHRGLIECACFSPDDRVLATGGADQLIRLWDTADWHSLGVLRGHRSLVLSLAFSPDGTRLISGDKDGQVKLWRVAARRPLFEGGHTPAALAADGSVVMEIGNGGARRIFQPARTAAPARISLPIETAAKAVTQSVCAGRIVLGGPQGELSLFGTDGTPQLPQLPRHSPRALPVLAPDGQYLVYVPPDTGLPAVWSFRESRRILQVTDAPVASSWPAISRNSRRLAIGFADGYVNVFDLAPPRLLGNFPAHKAFCYACDFSADGQLLVTAGFDGVVRLWHADTFQLVREFRSSADAYWSVAFSADGRRIAAGTGESVIALWDAATGNQVGSLALGEPLAPVEGQLRFSPQSDCLILCGNQQWRVWTTARPKSGSRMVD